MPDFSGSGVTWLGDPEKFQDKCGLARFAPDKKL